MTDLGWYLRRLSRMGPREAAGRAADLRNRHRLRRALPEPSTPLPGRRFTAVLPAGVSVPPGARARVLATADRLLDGHAEYFGVPRDDLVDPDWSFDPKTGRRAPVDTFAFDIPYRHEDVVGDIKQIWEPSRHQHLTVLATAHALTGEDRYAERVADHLKSWWAANPPMTGVHWVSGIELGIRLLSWVWVRRLLAAWPGAAGLFEDNPEALHQIWHHQRRLATFPSRGSSANNHVVAEAAGQLAAACAFPWFPESAGWRSAALRSLADHLDANTFGSGLNRELATEYHGLVLELGLAAAAEAGPAAPDSLWQTLLRMTDALAAVVDVRLRPPRQGDGDDGHGLVLDGHGTDRWSSLLSTGDAVFGRLDWWPRPRGDDVRTPLLAALAGRHELPGRPDTRADHFADAGLTLLRTPPGDGRAEIWCRCDGGPHGFLSIAAHAHADALSVEVRHDGVDILADPGTYCYHGEPGWRAYFRSTLGHNTVQLDDTDQSTSGGPFLWTRHARTRVLARPGGGVPRWCAEHDGYRPAVHRRTVELDPAGRALRITDEITADRPHRARLAFHLGPRVSAELSGNAAVLTWTAGGRDETAILELPGGLAWTAHRGRTAPPLGWYSPGYGRREPATTLIGSGCTGGALVTLLRFAR
ncbi:alginate lyase family protein [Amycolatopsis viridis]|uniref:Heparin-sulfate lyase N-terminal domain-containing protein n=1 Tax=Amycolatopsis viridis TaxID=185678 RepID=A0ABX0T0R0_9PSEU|nr:alginate lyase family protein [Amycolatopsis viridis]NIH82796.1 hypothetical protein [Amycolatopsis viridis]